MQGEEPCAKQSRLHTLKPAGDGLCYNIIPVTDAHTDRFGGSSP